MIMDCIHVFKTLILNLWSIYPDMKWPVIMFLLFWKNLPNMSVLNVSMCSFSPNYYAEILLLKEMV
jgi:hypothetical protein